MAYNFRAYCHGLLTLTMQFQWKGSNISLQDNHDNHISEMSTQLKHMQTTKSEFYHMEMTTAHKPVPTNLLSTPSDVAPILQNIACCFRIHMSYH